MEVTHARGGASVAAVSTAVFIWAAAAAAIGIPKASWNIWMEY